MSAHQQLHALRPERRRGEEPLSVAKREARRQFCEGAGVRLRAQHLAFTRLACGRQPLRKQRSSLVGAWRRQEEGELKTTMRAQARGQRKGLDNRSDDEHPLRRGAHPREQSRRGLRLQRVCSVSRRIAANGARRRRCRFGRRKQLKLAEKEQRWRSPARLVKDGIEGGVEAAAFDGGEQPRAS